ncbi:Aminotransferase PigE [Frankliniella fusca]|uniref:Aminotransferase PigE n=1 Tax=Frankliniella fusca TaxID=407009 RepID=A0AAE1HX99_9NEOP|nr:Aminotransferase PigE [Frankliniella fusca]
MKKMLKPAATRWLVLHSCVERYLILREQKALQGFFELRCFEDPDKKDKEAHEILAEIKNPFTKAYMEFLSYVLNVMNEFNALFQSKSVLIHKIYERSHALMKTLCMNFIKEEYLDKLADINVSNPHHLVRETTCLVSYEREFPWSSLIFLTLSYLLQLSEDEVEYGPGCAEALRNITPTPDNPNTRQQLARDILAFKQRCLHFYTTAGREIQNRLPLKDEILRQAAFLDPAVFLKPRSEPGALKDINTLVMHYKEKLQLDANATVMEWRTVPHTVPNHMHAKLKDMSVEDAWDELRCMKTGDERPTFPNLVKLAEAVMVLPHSNADAERGFSIVTDVRTKKRNRMGAACLNSICVSYSASRTTWTVARNYVYAFKSKGIDCVTFKVGPKHLAKHNKDMYKRE